VPWTGIFAVENELIVNNAGKAVATIGTPRRQDAAKPMGEITSPRSGAIVRPGETVSVTVTSATMHDAELAVVSPFGISSYAKSLPARLSITIPRDALRGSYLIAVYGLTASRLPLQSEPVEIHVEPPPVRCEDFESLSE